MQEKDEKQKSGASSGANSRNSLSILIESAEDPQPWREKSL